MLKYQWTSLTISTSSDIKILKNIVNTVKPRFGAVDTETSGLHIINDKPFVVQFGFLDEPNRRGFTFAVDLERTPSIANEALSYWTEHIYNPGGKLGLLSFLLHLKVQPFIWK